jgi:hypothetical protein
VVLDGNILYMGTGVPNIYVPDYYCGSLCASSELLLFYVKGSIGSPLI